MNRLTKVLSRCSGEQIFRCQFRGLAQLVSSSQATSSSPLVFSQLPTNAPPPSRVPDVFDVERLRISLPTLKKDNIIHTFPTIIPTSMIDPIISNGIIGRVDRSEVREIKMPSYSPPVAVYASPRLLTIRRKKMKKHKRRKRYDRDWSKYQKYHREKKLKAEREYEKRMKGHLAELEAFNAENYVRETIEASKKIWEKELAPTGRKLYPHWSRLMTLEELYGLPKSDYIDKRSGIPSEEDAAKINQLREKYKKEFKKED
ncbi:hypothetical protein PENTCL1PPCAC_6693 [Pristionchus entomophagus]|uniref:Uncharacterized protein n=1 Tax=Pristionchus entomophagus TaxID=358040 RepID=A0AAV5SQW7_9BILA|nr:hypothetical protein PENTCL1PPCAC_6693 [Pristionchus entomophagus]